MVDSIKKVFPDYEVILYCYSCFKNGFKPHCNYIELKGMQKYLETENYEPSEEMLKPMLQYVIRKLEQEQ